MIDELPCSTDSYQNLVSGISDVYSAARDSAARSVNSILVQAYWEIGRYIVEFEQGGDLKSEYGSKLIERLSRDLTTKFGKGFSRSNLIYIRKFYITHQIGVTASHQLSWSHYYQILKADDELEISFYERECEIEGWSVRELRRQMDSMLFHRIALSKDKEGIIELAREGCTLSKPSDILRDPYVLEFAGIPDTVNYLEGDLEDALVRNLESFLLELGKGFAFIGRQYKINIGGKFYYVDLVFYHRILKCFVLIDLKRGEVDHNDVGQMNFYLNYFREEENCEDDNPPIGIVLGAYKDKLAVEYALAGISNQLFVSKYQLYLPGREQLEHELGRILDARERCRIEEEERL